MDTFRESMKKAIFKLNVEELRHIIRQSIQTTKLRSLLEDEKVGSNLFHDLAETFNNRNSSHETLERDGKNSSFSIYSGNPDNTPVRPSYQSDDTAARFSLMDPEREVVVPPWKWLRYLPRSEKDDKRLKIAHILSEYGEDVNGVDSEGYTPLYLACVCRDAFLCDVLLQCGADPNISIKELPIIIHVANFCIQEEVLRKGNGRVRRLLNCWCRVDISREEQTLRELAVSTCNETIISLLIDIQCTMDIIHKCLAGSSEGVKEVLENSSSGKINLNLKKMSERSAPILYFLIRFGETSLLQLLMEEGASPFAIMQDEDARDIPVIFTALEPDASPEIVEILLPANPDKNLYVLDSIRYKGKSILREALENEVCDQTIMAIIRVGGPTFLVDRDEKGVFPLDALLKKGRNDLVLRVDKLVREWLTQPDVFPGWREILVLRGFNRLENAIKTMMSFDEKFEAFLSDSKRCQEVIDQLFEAVQNDDEKSFGQLCDFQSEYFHVTDLLYQGMAKDNNLPLLHWITFHGRPKMLAVVLDSYFENLNTKQKFLSRKLTVDDIRDPWRRTPLHYAYGMKNRNREVRLLSNSGATDHTLDMFYREPLDFKDGRGTESLENLLQNIKNKNIQINQDEPWQPKVFLRHQEKQRKQRFKDSMRKHPQHHHHHHHSHHLQHRNSILSFSPSNHECISYTTNSIPNDQFLYRQLSYNDSQRRYPNFYNSAAGPNYVHPVSASNVQGTEGFINMTNQRFYDTQLRPETDPVSPSNDEEFMTKRSLASSGEISNYFNLCTLV